jgi:hypothetical protein
MVLGFLRKERPAMLCNFFTPQTSIFFSRISEKKDTVQTLFRLTLGAAPNSIAQCSVVLEDFPRGRNVS